MDLKQPRKMYPGMWRYSTNPNLCCIYRVPNCLREVNPQAYTPQLVLIGPLHHSLKSQALKSLDLGDITYTKSMGYINMEEHKKIYFGFQGKIRKDSTFTHFTDLFRCVRVETLPKHDGAKCKSIDLKFNAEKLYNGGVKFEAVKEEFPFDVKFENGCLKMPCLRVDDDLELRLRNIIALEQCHYPYSTHVCNYVIFLDSLIDTDKDVALLVEKGILLNWIGEPGSVAKMVNKLGLGTWVVGSHYSDIAAEVNTHYLDPVNKSRALLKRVYFGDLWTGTATIAATFLLVMSLIQTVASIIQVLQNAS